MKDILLCFVRFLLYVARCLLYFARCLLYVVRFLLYFPRFLLYSGRLPAFFLAAVCQLSSHASRQAASHCRCVEGLDRC